MRKPQNNNACSDPAGVQATSKQRNIIPQTLSSGLIICAETQRSKQMPSASFASVPPLWEPELGQRGVKPGVDRPILAIS